MPINWISDLIDTPSLDQIAPIISLATAPTFLWARSRGPPYRNCVCHHAYGLGTCSRQQRIRRAEIGAPPVAAAPIHWQIARDHCRERLPESARRLGEASVVGAEV